MSTEAVKGIRIVEVATKQRLREDSELRRLSVRSSVVSDSVIIICSCEF
jgi:hypothetical protein